ncbi:MAG: tetratricopeptide repeat protein [Verrucomicrobiales bacterium]|nr:tetratricopeptide repeat protein [Verrucomicrobiales bacterium]
MRTFLLISLLAASPLTAAEPLPIDPLWQSETFRKSITASYGIDSRIEPRITEDEAFYLDESAKAMAANDRAKAISVLRESSLLEKSPAMLFTLASHLFEAGEAKDADESVKFFESALAQFPNFRDAHRNLGVVLIQREEFEKAKTHLVRALALGSQDGTTAGLIAYCHARDGHHQAALDAYRLAMLTQPEERQWKLGEAQALLALKRPLEAASILQALIALAPGETATWLIQADAWSDLDESLAAAANLEIVHRAGTLEPNALLSLGHLYLQSDLPELALERYRAALASTNPPSPTRAVESLELFLSRSDWPLAKEYVTTLETVAGYREALDPAKGEKDLLSRLTRARAVLELETGDAATGAKRIEEWLRREPLDGECLLLLARFREEAGQKIEAAMLLEQAARIPETAAGALLAHGRLLVAAADYEKALEHLEKSQELSPNESLSDYIVAIRELVGGASVR